MESKATSNAVVSHGSANAEMIDTEENSRENDATQFSKGKFCFHISYFFKHLQDVL